MPRTKGAAKKMTESKISHKEEVEEPAPRIKKRRFRPGTIALREIRKY